MIVLFPVWILMAYNDPVQSHEVEILPLCSSEVELAGPVPPPPEQQRVAVLPEPVAEVHLDLGENGTWPLRALKSIGFQVMQCTLRLEACPDCVIGLELDSIRSYFTQFHVEKVSNCNDPTSAMSDSCFRMEFVEEHSDFSTFKEARRAVYRRISVWDAAERRFFNSSGHSLLVNVAMRNVEGQSQLFQSLMQLFPIKIAVYRNTETKDNFSPDQFIQSPRYPSAYPRHVVKSYVLENRRAQGRVRLLFDDFLLDFHSHLRVFDSDGRELFSSLEVHRRPPPLLSTGTRLSVLFVSGAFSHPVGFRARVEFVSSHHEWAERPSEANCDQVLENYGGRITLDGQESLIGKRVDCIWVVGRLPSFGQVYDQVYLKVEQFQTQSPDLSLEIRRGLHSTAQKVLELHGLQNVAPGRSRKLESFVSDESPNPAFYLRLRGQLQSVQGFEVVFALFYRWATASCPGRAEFHCENNKCVHEGLRCDGLDHCGDGSDERCVLRATPSAAADPDATLLVAVVLSVAGLVLVLASSASLILGIHRRKRHLSEGPDAPSRRADPPNTDRASVHTLGDRRFYLLAEPRLSVLEAPPSYADALKHCTMGRRASNYDNGAFQLQSMEFERTGVRNGAERVAVDEQRDERPMEMGQVDPLAKTRAKGREMGQESEACVSSREDGPTTRSGREGSSADRSLTGLGPARPEERGPVSARSVPGLSESGPAIDGAVPHAQPDLPAHSNQIGSARSLKPVNLDELDGQVESGHVAEPTTTLRVGSPEAWV